MENKNSTLIKIIQTGILAALCFVSFTFLSIKIPVGGGDAVSLHIGNAFCVLAALLLGGVYGGLSGAIGMTISDLLDPTYAIGAPKTFILKLCIGLITGLIAHKFAKIDQSNDTKYIAKWTLIASIGGLAFNVVFDPLVGYFYKQYVLGQPQQVAEVLAKFSVFATSVNAVVSVILVSVIYNALRPILTKSGLLLPVSKSESVANQ
ncbi:ECF transporter S component [Clostridium sp.]|uniref:ECF transporter S component n=1 Tax=Clostridium sp. TaxID=1506 RepID=UPI00260BE923|nr:ECF transporter S component [Clostridium sp.]